MQPRPWQIENVRPVPLESVLAVIIQPKRSLMHRGSNCNLTFCQGNAVLTSLEMGAIWRLGTNTPAGSSPTGANEVPQETEHERQDSDVFIPGRHNDSRIRSRDRGHGRSEPRDCGI